MAKILPFDRAALRPAEKTPAPAGGATIIIFPGVRYERRDNEADPPMPRRRRGGKR